MQHQGSTLGLGTDQKVSTEGGGRDGNIGNFLPYGSSGSAIVWSGYMGDFGTNGADLRESACEFPAADKKKKVKVA